MRTVMGHNLWLLRAQEKKARVIKDAVSSRQLAGCTLFSVEDAQAGRYSDWAES